MATLRRAGSQRAALPPGAAVRGGRRSTMVDQESYWIRKTISRRAALRGAAAGGGLAAVGLAGCSSSKKTASTGAAAPAPVAAIDPTKGKPGGKLIMQAQADARGLVQVKTANNLVHQLASFT